MIPASKLRRRLLIVAGLLLLFTLVGFFLLPVIAKSQLEKRLSAELGRRVSVEKVRINPYAVSVTLENFSIREPDGTTPFVGWRRLYVDVDVLASLWKEWAVSEISLEGFAARVAIKPDASFNFADIIARLSPPGSPAPAKPKGEPGRPIRVGSLKVADARLDFADAAARKPFATTLGPVTFTLTDFRTVSEQRSPHHFEAVTEAGEKIVWTGSARAEALHSAGTFALENFSLQKYAPYYAHRLQADLTGGTLSVRGTYELNLAEGKRAMALRDGAVQLRGIKLVERANQELAFELPSLDVTGIQADALTMKASVASVVLAGGTVRARREKDGSINLLTMLQPTPEPAVTPSPTARPVATAATMPTKAAQAPDFTVAEVALKDFRVEVSDLAAPRPATLALSGIDASIRNVTLAEGAQMPLTFAANWAPQGTIKVNGNVGIAPVKAELELALAGVEFLPLSPYLEQFANAHLTGGALTLALKVQASLPAGQPPVATVSGDIQLDKLGLVDSANNAELAGFRSLALRGLRVATSPDLSLALDEINLAGPYARAVMNADKTLNFASIARTPATAPTGAPASHAPAPPAATAPAPAPTPKIEIGKIVISDGDFRFNDRSLQPNVSTALNQFGGTIAGLSSTNPAKADLNLKGMVDGAGPVAIVGKIDPLGATKFVDLKIDFKNVDLLPLSAYSGKFAGYELARGKLMLDVTFKVDGKKIDAANVITLNQFTFGGAVKSPEATSLPVRLGVALLKDMDGKIVIDVPIQGQTDDPSFKISRVVLRVIVNLLTKAAVSPFALLGSAFGGGGDELAYQEFIPGTAELNPAEVKKLETMVKALTNRPGLSVDLQGSYDAAADGFALKRVKLTEQVRRAVWEAKRQSNPNIAPPDQLVISPEETAATLKTLYDAKFPPGTEFGTPLPKPPAVVTPPPPPAGFFRRIANAITQQSKKDQRAAEQENAKRGADHAAAVAAAAATGVPLEEMTGRLAETVTIDDNDLRSLAQARAQRVRDYFTTVGKIDPERLFLAKDQTDAAKQGKGPRVFLGLQ
ncbi:DUF748 domain-containing protein [Horticoccus sp. 23ND18S-11]|uniref:DUF748 domain-containing protein n=1 Tax=Horticoccus sp. 23ND18S-11 TaxID=3391832 RepID=UPI0039C91FD0